MDPTQTTSDTRPSTGNAKASPSAWRRRARGVLSWLLWLVPALLIGTGLKTWVAEPYQVPSGSMIPTIEPGDWIVANKLAGDLGDFHHGDLVVFRPPETVEDDVDALVKRIIGLPGDRIEFVDGGVIRNSVPLDEPYLAAGTVTTAKRADPLVVPDGRFFVLGDHRGRSVDSRAFGTVDGDLIIGRASVRLWPIGDAGGF